ncbi:MAG: ATP-dependent DNA helicase [Gammaproteobacteria bacterium]
MRDDPRTLLGAEGPFARLLPGFAPRAEQQDMAEAVHAALGKRGRLVVEAGTGVGKTFAYLVPALLAEERVILSTGTRNLQDQLFFKDLPLVLDALDLHVNTALLKGRANYLCLHRLETAVHDTRPQAQKHTAVLQRMQSWGRRSERGDIVEFTDVPEDSPLWPRVTSTVDNCLGSECPRYDACFVVKARRQAQEAELVVINHHLFMADLSLKDTGFGELLPEAGAVILDEAHQLPEVASQFFGTSLGSRQLLDLAQDTVAEQIAEAHDMTALRTLAADLEKATRDFRLLMGREGQRAAWQPMTERREIADGLQTLQDNLTTLTAALDSVAERGKGLANCYRRATQSLARLHALVEPEDAVIQWFETFPRSFVIHSTPLDIATPFQQQMARRDCAWVFTSATLTVDGGFDHFCQRMGVTDTETLQLDSPFDFQNNALLYLPPDMPDPNSEAHTRAVVEEAIPLIQANGGRCFLLFTSYRALRTAAGRLQGRVDYPLLVQGEAPRAVLIERFRELGNAVLLGTSSFWEGVDVRGQALSLVIIDKLPFASPGDPVLSARLDAIRAGGGNPFMEYQVPQAAIALKQGVGRLIRDVNDRGLLVLCDPRVTGKHYGRVFLRSLPEIPRTRRRAEALDFLAACQEVA